MSGRVVHFEIPFDDQERATAFYAEAFDWTLAAMPEMSYVLATTGPSDQGPPSEPGFINGGMLERGLPVGSPVLVVDVEDINATLHTVERLGGTIVSAPPERPDVEREIVRTAVTQLRMIVVGAANWRSRD